jgi:hypothetical protein
LNWTPECQKAFDEIKALLAEDAFVARFVQTHRTATQQRVSPQRKRNGESDKVDPRPNDKQLVSTSA